MKFIAHLDTKEWSIEPSSEPFVMNYEISVKDSDKKIVEFDHVSFGYDLFQGETLIDSESFPPENVVYISSDQDYIVAGNSATISPDKEYNVRVWIKNADYEFEKSFSFVTPKPVKPFESWVWNEESEDWEPPIPYPTNDPDNFYSWSEEENTWVIDSQE